MYYFIKYIAIIVIKNWNLHYYGNISYRINQILFSNKRQLFEQV